MWGIWPNVRPATERKHLMYGKLSAVFPEQIRSYNSLNICEPMFFQEDFKGTADIYFEYIRDCADVNFSQVLRRTIELINIPS